MNFSIILPTHNRASFLPNAVKSVINQTYSNWELIVVDDGSTDNTKDIIEEYIGKDNRIKYIYQENQERSSARNNGITNSHGEWVCFLDSDDLFHKTHLEEFKSLIKLNNLEKGIYFSGVSIGEFSKELEVYDLSHKNNIEFIMINTFATPQACVSRSILNEQKFNEKIDIGEDRDLWVRISMNYPVFFHCSKTLIQIDHPNRSVNLNSEKESLQTLKSILKTIKISRAIKKKILSNSIFNISKMYLRKNQRTMAFLVIGRAILKDISNKQNKHRILLLLSLIGLYKPIYSEYEK